jgi:hypothetical protein
MPAALKIASASLLAKMAPQPRGRGFVEGWAYSFISSRSCHWVNVDVSVREVSRVNVPGADSKSSVPPVK